MLEQASGYTFSVRLMGIRDADRVAHLAAQLGFAGTASDIAERFAHLSAHKHHVVLVAEDHSGIVGWVHAYVAPSLLSATTAEIGGMVVDRRHRRRHIGTALMVEAERWAVERGCKSILLATQLKREGAQAFYRSLGFEVEFATYFMRKDAQSFSMAPPL